MGLDNINKLTLDNVLPELQKEIDKILEQDNSSIETHKYLSDMQHAYLTIKMYGWISEKQIPAVQSVIPDFNPPEHAIRSIDNIKTDTQGSIKVTTY